MLSDARLWTVVVIEPNKFEANIIADILRGAGVQKVRVAYDQSQAEQVLEVYPADVVVASFDMEPLDGAAWTRAFRRNRRLMNRKAAVFLTSHAFSRLVAEQCRHAGANALIGKPLSSKTLISTIGKVLEKPRPFVDNEGDGYVGPCRRAGIVTACASRLRRRSDAAEAPTGLELKQFVSGLVSAAATAQADLSKIPLCITALKPLQAAAEQMGDGPMMRGCAVLLLHLTTPSLRPEAMTSGLRACVDGFQQLLALEPGQNARRDAVAETMRQAVARAAQQQAA